MKILCINTHGRGGQDERRLCLLMEGVAAETTFFHLDRSRPAESVRALWKAVRSKPWDLIYQEGTGILGGMCLLGAFAARRQRFVVSSGDPVGGFFQVTRGPVFGAVFGAYEALLCRACAGYVGWTPYLTGAALHLGAKRAVTIEGAAALDVFRPLPPAQRLAARRKYGLPPEHLVCGIVGSLRWTPRQSYCYGLELVETLKRLERPDVSLLIVGEGSGRHTLEARLPERLRGRVVFTGRLSEADVVEAMNVMDIGFIPQTLDRLGNFRLTTKLPEYLACGLPVAMSPVPGYYEYVGDAGWPLPACHPASAEFHQRCARWLETLSHPEIALRATQARPAAARHFDAALLRARFHDFLESIFEDDSGPCH